MTAVNFASLFLGAPAPSGGFVPETPHPSLVSCFRGARVFHDPEAQAWVAVLNTQDLVHGGADLVDRFFLSPDGKRFYQAEFLGEQYRSKASGVKIFLDIARISEPPKPNHIALCLEIRDGSTGRISLEVLGSGRDASLGEGPIFAAALNLLDGVKTDEILREGLFYLMG